MNHITSTNRRIDSAGPCDLCGAGSFMLKRAGSSVDLLMRKPSKKLRKIRRTAVQDARKAVYERDCLALACGNTGQAHAENRNTKSARAAKVRHLRNQNAIGASLVQNFMAQQFSGSFVRNGPEAAPLN